jgi:hypothetical protein
MDEHLHYFRPGEEARMLARCQFDVTADGRCRAILAYPIKGYPWRRNVTKYFEFQLSADELAELFADVRRLKAEHPAECLSNDELWSDSSEKGNGITRDRHTNTLCHTIGISAAGEPGRWREHFAMRENSAALLNSALYRTLSRLVGPYETNDRGALGHDSQDRPTAGGRTAAANQSRTSALLDRRR